MLVFFFFSSRRRHTRCSRDWSSDVCSSDLGTEGKREMSPAEIAQKLAAEIAKTGIADEKNAPEVTVVPTNEGVMIQLTDKVDRSEERRVGKECRSRWSRDH